MTAELKAETIIAKDVIKSDVVVRAVDVAVLECMLFTVCVLILEILTALMCDTDLDAVLAVAAADIHARTPFTPRAELHVDGAGRFSCRRTLRDDVDDARDGTLTVQRGVRPTYDLDALYVADGDLIHIDRIIIAADHEVIPVDLFAVHHDEDACVAVDDRVGGKALLHDVNVRTLEGIGDALVVAALDLLLRDQCDIRWHVADRRLTAARRDDDIVQCVGLHRLTCCLLRTCRRCSTAHANGECTGNQSAEY